jgi:DNA-binding transcriptional ArsR family regulator
MPGLQDGERGLRDPWRGERLGARWKGRAHHFVELDLVFMRSEDGLRPSSSAKFWETAEDHRFALEVLQLRLRRDIMKFIGRRIRTEEEIAEEFRLSQPRAEYHLALLEKALVVEHRDEGYGCTPTGLLYLERVEGWR